MLNLSRVRYEGTILDLSNQSRIEDRVLFHRVSGISHG